MWQAPTAIAAAGEDELALKRSFAALLLKNPMKPHEAAMQIFPGEPGKFLPAADHWPHDAFVVACMNEMRAEGSQTYLPAKEQTAREILTLAQNEKYGLKDRLDAFKLYAEYMGMITKASELKVTTPLDNPIAALMEQIASNGRPRPSTTS